MTGEIANQLAGLVALTYANSCAKSTPVFTDLQVNK